MHLQEAVRAAALLDARPLIGAATDLATAARVSVAIEGLATSQGTDTDSAVPEAAVDLTPREREILPLLAAGRTNAEIADALIISPRTVGVHVSRILQKLGASRRTEAAFIAQQRGLLDS